MQTIQVGQLKSQFSAVLEDIKNNGEKYIVEYGRSHKKIAMIVPYEAEVKKREFGFLEGQSVIPSDFDDEIDELTDSFYGSNP